MNTQLNMISGSPLTTGATPSASPDPLANKTTFLQLLVAQLKNQNPLNPADGIQFVSQLAQFSALEETMTARQDLDAIRKAIEQRLPVSGAKTPTS